MSMHNKPHTHDDASTGANQYSCHQDDCTCAACLLTAPLGPNISRMADLIVRELDAQVAARLEVTRPSGARPSDTEETNR